MEQYHKLVLERERNGQSNSDFLTNVTRKNGPVIVVHCKAGKGRTGMMICSLLVFLGMFSTHTEAIRHYNKQRAINMKALTINSQKRYV